MAQLFFDCSSATDVLLDRRGRRVDDLGEARDHAARLVLGLIATPSHEDWRGWVMHVSDEEGEEIFEVPFATLLGKPH